MMSPKNMKPKSIGILEIKLLFTWKYNDHGAYSAKSVALKMYSFD